MKICLICLILVQTIKLKNQCSHFNPVLDKTRA